MRESRKTDDDDDADCESDGTVKCTTEPRDLSGDRLNLLLLMLLYVMQGVTLGFSVAGLPVIMESKKCVSYEDQALFSLVLWPNSIKLLWAPLVDAFYVQRIGRRKSWLLPVQYSMGACLIYSAVNIDGWLPETGYPNMAALTTAFLILNVLAATLDIVSNGWALTMLNKANVSYSSASSSSGLAIGVMLGSVVPVLITSEDFCNRYLRIAPCPGGVMTLERLLFVWGVIFLSVSTLIGVFKREKDNRLEENHVHLNVVQNYKLLWDILKLPSIRILLIALLTMRVGFSTTRVGLVNLKLVDAGVPKDGIMILTTATFAVKILTPIAVSKYTSGPKPISICLNTIAIRLFWSLTYMFLIHFTPMLINRNGIIDVPIYYYLILGFLNAVNEGLAYVLLVAMTAFFSRISDSRFGGTYMTLLNTMVNLGLAWSSSLGLKMMDYLTFKRCSNNPRNDCSTTDFKNTCDLDEGHCVMIVDGYYIEVVLCIVIGFVWYGVFKNVLKSFETKSSAHWLVYVDRSSKEVEIPNGTTSSM